MGREISYLQSLFIMTIAFVLLAQTVSAQEKLTRERSRDVFDELERQALPIRFYDALTGIPIKNADVIIGASYQVQTDFEGRAFLLKPDEDQSINVKFIHPDYITSEFEIEILLGTIFFNRFSVSPKLSMGALRVVLDWGSDPKDLDMHFVKGDEYHISYRNMKVSIDGIAKLDKDNMNGFGPETITASLIDPKVEYHLYVHDFVNKDLKACDALSNSKATIKVYGDNKLLEVFQVPETGKGIYWDVFKIVNGRIQKVDELKDVI